MSWIMFGNVATSVPAVLDTTPCMNQMLNYEDCVHEYHFFGKESNLCWEKHASVSRGLAPKSLSLRPSTLAGPPFGLAFWPMASFSSSMTSHFTRRTFTTTISKALRHEINPEFWKEQQPKTPDQKEQAIPLGMRIRALCLQSLSPESYFFRRPNRQAHLVGHGSSL